MIRLWAVLLVLLSACSSPAGKAFDVQDATRRPGVKLEAPVITHLWILPSGENLLPSAPEAGAPFRKVIPLSPERARLLLRRERDRIPYPFLRTGNRTEGVASRLEQVCYVGDYDPIGEGKADAIIKIVMPGIHTTVVTSVNPKDGLVRVNLTHRDVELSGFSRVVTKFGPLQIPRIVQKKVKVDWIQARGGYRAILVPGLYLLVARVD